MRNQCMKSECFWEQRSISSQITQWLDPDRHSQPLSTSWVSHWPQTHTREELLKRLDLSVSYGAADPHRELCGFELHRGVAIFHWTVSHTTSVCHTLSSGWDRPQNTGRRWVSAERRRQVFWWLLVNLWSQFCSRFMIHIFMHNKWCFIWCFISNEWHSDRVTEVQILFGGYCICVYENNLKEKDEKRDIVNVQRWINCHLFYSFFICF